MNDRLDDILCDWAESGGQSIASLPETDHGTVREAVRHSIEVNGVHNTADHWQAFLAVTGPMPQEIADSLRLTFNQTVAECF